MMKTLTLVLVIAISIGICNGGVYGRNSQQSYRGPANSKQTFLQPAANVAPSNGSSGKSFTGWGIVGLLTLIIVAGLGLYYVVLCYPILCSDDDFSRMDSSSSMTETPNKSPLPEHDENRFRSQSSLAPNEYSAADQQRFGMLDAVDNNICLGEMHHMRGGVPKYPMDPRMNQL